MDIKTVYFLLSFFIVYCGAGYIYRYLTGIPIKLDCNLRTQRRVLERIKIIFASSSQGSSAEDVVIMEYSIKELNVTYIHEKFANEFNTTEMKPEKKNEKLVLPIVFRSTKTWHSGRYCCLGVKDDIQVESGHAYLVFFQNEMEITPCKDSQNFLLGCSIFNLDIEPEKVDLLQDDKNSPSLKTKIPVYTKISNRSRSYNITAKTVVPRSYIGKQILCIVKFKNAEHPFMYSNPVNLTEENTSKKDTIICLPHLEIDKRKPIWEKVGKSNITFSCTFDIPHEEEIKKIEWFHHDTKENRLMCNWTNEMGQYAELDYEKETFTSIAPIEVEGRQVTSLTLKTAMFNQTGNYTCSVSLSRQNQSKTAHLVIYQLDEPIFTAVGCSDQKVRLECNTGKVYPRPKEIVLSFYNPETQLQENLTSSRSEKIEEEEGVYNITVKMIARIDEIFPSARLNFSCDVVLSSEPHILNSSWTNRKTNVTDSMGNMRDVCSPKVEIEPQLHYVKAGETPELMKCKFDIPAEDEIESIKWIHWNFTAENVFYAWEKKRNKTTIIGDYEISDPSLIIPHAIEDRQATTLILKMVGFKHNGNYTCRVKFTFAGTHSNTTNLVVYEMSPQFTAIGCSDERVRLECKDESAFPAPRKVEFSLFDPVNRLLLKLNDTVSTEIKEVNGRYNFTSKMFTRLDQLNSVDVSPKVVCDVILDLEFPITERRFATRTTYVTDRTGKRIDVCSPKVEVEPRLQWLKVGTESLSMQCKFDLPLHDEIETVDWFHQNMSQLFSKSEVTIKPNYPEKIKQSSLIADDTEGKKVATLNLDTAEIEHSGNYTCRVNYRIAGNSSGSGEFVVYQINKPYYFYTVVNRDFEVVLECKAGDLFPEPEEIVFSRYDPDTKSISKLDKKPVTEIIPMNNGLFNISAKMRMQVNESESVEYICDVVLSKDLNITESTFERRFYDISDISTSETSGTQKTTIIIASSVVGLSLFIIGLVYVLRRFWSPCVQDTSSSEEDKNKAGEEHISLSWFPWKSS